MSYALEMGSREAVLVGGALIDRGQMSAAARQQFASSVASRRNLMSVALALLTPDLSAPYASVTSSPQYQTFQNMEDQISGGSGPIPVDPAAWQADSGAFLAGMQKAEIAGGVKLSQMSASLGDRLVLEAGLAGGLGLVAVIASISATPARGASPMNGGVAIRGGVGTMAMARPLQHDQPHDHWLGTRRHHHHQRRLHGFIGTALTLGLAKQAK